MDKQDYRNTTYCKKLKDIKEQKNKLKKQMRDDGKRTDNFYPLVSKEYKRKYLEIYNNKCSYCGVSMITVGYHMIEIDHYKNKASYPTEIEAGELNNLVVSCRTCNRSKSEMKLSNKYLNKLNPDLHEIKKYFYRDEDYSIKIVDEFKEEKEVLKFYNKLKFNYEFRKLDFLLLNIDGFFDTLEPGNFKTKIGELRGLLRDKRSLIYTTEE